MSGRIDIQETLDRAQVMYQVFRESMVDQLKTDLDMDIAQGEWERWCDYYYCYNYFYSLAEQYALSTPPAQEIDLDWAFVGVQEGTNIQHSNADTLYRLNSQELIELVHLF